VPLVLQRYIERHLSKYTSYGIGRHPEHGFFVVEIRAFGTSPCYLTGWLADIQKKETLGHTSRRG